METRNKRYVKKVVEVPESGKTREESREKGRKRLSVGAALGLTPNATPQVNLTMARAAGAAVAAAARLDAMNAANITFRRRPRVPRTRTTPRRKRGPRKWTTVNRGFARSAGYEPSSRASMMLMRETRKHLGFDSGTDEKNEDGPEEEGTADMPPSLTSRQKTTPRSNPNLRGRGVVSSRRRGRHPNQRSQTASS